MTRDDGQRRQQDLDRYLLKMAQAIGCLPLWANDHELERLRQLRLDKREGSNPCYPETLTMPKAQQEGENR